MKKVILTFTACLLLHHAYVNAQSAKELKQAYEQLSIFQDPLATQLQNNIKLKQLNTIADPALKAHALRIFHNSQETRIRNRSYKAILSPTALGQDLAIGDGYSKFEHITGIYLPVGKHVIVVDGIDDRKDVKLLVPNWLRKAPNPDDPTKDPKGWGIEKKEFTLKNGVNIIDLKDFGSLAYIYNFSEDPSKEKDIKVHFLTGQVNGYFDSRVHTDDDWDRLLSKATFPIMDAIGKHIQIAYPVESLKKYASGRGLELLNNYDSLVYRQHRIMGLEKYNKIPKNRILSRVNYNYYMFRDGDGVAYMGDKKGYAMGMVVDPSRVIKGDPCWGFSHEVGHVHQTRPMFNWGGLGEVSNNLFSLYVTRSFGNKTRISEQNNYDKSRKSIIENKISYLQDEDVFNRLVPFWQLQLYFEGTGNNPNFYPDLFEAFRMQSAKLQAERPRIASNWSAERMQGERNPAVHQLNFIKTACEVAKVDLTDFFDSYGFFYVGKMTYDDYGKYTYEMTQGMVNDCKKLIKTMNLPKPKLDITKLRD